MVKRRHAKAYSPLVQDSSRIASALLDLSRAKIFAERRSPGAPSFAASPRRVACIQVTPLQDFGPAKHQDSTSTPPPQPSSPEAPAKQSASPPSAPEPPPHQALLPPPSAPVPPA